ncbi:hypothetical protein [Clostridium sp. YIM B02506]|uniref:hypothetical protein n=1 Tax=Clostridium sp. YIM B02506 TaxID=2910680 RepID=UPI001EEF70D2|nr:hypothetical protein [Clostridium sp. YIM B02506]
MIFLNWLWNIVTSTIFTTVIIGVLVFIIGQFILKFLIEPLSEYKRLKSKIAYALVFYANMYSNPTEITEEFIKDIEAVKNLEEAKFYMRNLSAEFSGWLQVMPFYGFFSIIRIIPSRKKADEVRGYLIGISNSLAYSKGVSMHNLIDANYKRQQKISKILKLH